MFLRPGRSDRHGRNCRCGTRTFPTGEAAPGTVVLYGPRGGRVDPPGICAGEPENFPIALHRSFQRPIQTRVSIPERLGSEPVYLIQDIFGIKVRRVGIRLIEANDALFVNDDYGAVGRAPLRVVNVVQLGNVAVGMKVGQHGVRNRTQRCRKRGLSWSGVGANTQYLGILLLEIRVEYPERGDLVRSTACKGKDVEG